MDAGAVTGERDAVLGDKPVLKGGEEGSTTQQTRGKSDSSTLLPSGWAPHPEPALLCCPGEVQGLLSQVLQQVRGRASFPACHC